MRAHDRASRHAPWLLALVALLAGVGPAHAQLFGTVELQYQDLDEIRDVALPDGTHVLRRFQTDLFVKSIDVRHQNYLRQNLLMDTNLRFAETTRPGTADRTRTPLGSIRLIHPVFQFTAAHQPTTIRSSGTILNSAPGSDTTGVVTTSRATETMLIGQANTRSGLQVNATWMDRRREAGDGAAQERGVTRNARAAFTRDRWSTYALIGDQEQREGEQRRGKQEQYGGGGQWRADPARGANVTLRYDVSGSRSHPNATFTTTSNSQNAIATADWAMRRTFGTSASYNWRRVDSWSARDFSQVDQEGTLLGRWTPARGLGVTGGGGFRTIRLEDGSPMLLDYLTAVATAEGMARRNWTVNSSLAHTTTRDPARGTYGTEALSGISRMNLSPRVSLDALISISQNGDTASAPQRWSNSWNARLRTQPLRTLYLIAGVRTQRVGPGLLDPISVSRGATFDGTWRPHPSVDAIGNYSINESLSEPHELTRTWSSNVRALLSPKWQLQAAWTRTAQPRVLRGLATIETHDQAGGRLLYQHTRWMNATVAWTVTDAGTNLESTRMEGTFTWSFGR